MLALTKRGLALMQPVPAPALTKLLLLPQTSLYVVVVVPPLDR